MFRLLVIFAVVSCVVGAPGYAVGGYGIPAATSYSSRIDYHTPVIKTVVGTPLVSSYGHGLGYSSVYGGLGYGNGLYYNNGLTYGHAINHGHGYGYGYSPLY